jgi:Fic family protein
LCEYVSISRVLRKFRTQFWRSFNDTLADENDTTYFILYHLRIIAQAIRELREYLERKSSEIKDVETRLLAARTGADLNRRQLDVLASALKEPTAAYTIESHRRAHDTAFATSRSDLLRLAELRLLEQQKRGRSFVFVPAGDLREKLPAEPVQSIPSTSANLEPIASTLSET